MSTGDRVRRWVNATFFVAVIAVNFTLSRPSPVDILLIVALLMSVAAGQFVTVSVLALLGLLATWLTSLYISSFGLVDDPEVTYQMLKITFAVSIGICSALVSSHWSRLDVDRFLRFYILSACIAAALGTAGFLLSIEDLTWDGRGKGLFDDPNMYAAFLSPAILACVYQLHQPGRRRLVYAAALALLVVGQLMSFSRVSIVGCAIWTLVFYLFLQRHDLKRAVARALILVLAVTAVVGVAAVSDPDFADKLADRSTIAKDYDLGHGGRYSRYALSIPIILDNPLGIGLLQVERIFDEPLHNIVLNSFMNFGWLAGFTLLAIVIVSITISVTNYRRSRDPIFLFMLICWASIFTAALVHEAERWRHLWLFTGLVWGLRPRLLAAGAAAAPSAALPRGSERATPLGGSPVAGAA